MTNPAVLRIYSDDHDGAFASDWAAPEKVLPCLARWVEWCAVSNVMPTATSYFEFAAADHGDHFRADYGVDAPDPDHAEYRYVVRSRAMDEGWIADLTIWRGVPRPGREPLLTVWHQVTFSHDTIGPLHQLAAIGLDRVVADVESLNRPHLTEAAVRTWSEQADWHRSLSGVAA